MPLNPTQKADESDISDNTWSALRTAVATDETNLRIDAMIREVWR